jgi:hypothetical protein
MIYVGGAWEGSLGRGREYNITLLVWGSPTDIETRQILVKPDEFEDYITTKSQITTKIYFRPLITALPLIYDVLMTSWLPYRV